MADQFKNDALEEGRGVWKTLQGQLFELQGFVLALLGSVWAFAWRNVLLLILLPLIAGAGGFFYSRMQPPLYRAGMTVSYVFLEKKIYADMLMKLDAILKSGSRDQAMEMLGVNEEVIETLVCVDAENIKGEPLAEDLSSERIPFNVVVYVTSLEHLGTLEKGIVHFLNSPGFIKDRLQFNEEKARADSEALRAEIEELKQLRIKVREENRSEEEAVSLATMIQDTRKLLDEAHTQLQFNVNVEVLHGFIVGEGASLRKPIHTAAMFFAGGFLLALAIALLREKFKKAAPALS